jgi:hypothetical protein
VATLFANPRYTPVDAQGDPYPGATLTFYAAGTTNPQPVYTTSAATVPHPNPVTANSAGQFPAIYYDDALQYRALLRDATGVLLWDVDNIDTAFSPEELGRGFYPRSTAEISLNVFPTAYRWPYGDAKRYGAVGNGVTDDTVALQAAISQSALPGGADATLGAGTFQISATLRFPDGARLSGVGRTRTIIRLAANANVNLMEKAVGATGNSVVIRDLEFNGNDANNTQGGIFWQGANNARGPSLFADNVRFTQCRAAVGTGGANGAVVLEGNVWGVLRDCDVTNNQNAIGLFHKGSDWVFDSLFLGPNGATANVQSMILQAGAGNLFQTCYFGGNGGTEQVLLWGAQRNLFVGCLNDNAWEHGYRLIDFAGVPASNNMFIGGQIGQSGGKTNNTFSSVSIEGAAVGNIFQGIQWKGEPHTSSGNRAAYAVSESGTAGSNVIDSGWTGNNYGTAFKNLRATGNSIVRGIVGFNPQGAAAITVGGSPFTYTNQDHVSQAVYITGGSVSGIAKNSLTLFSSSEQTVWLDPGESVTVTYSSAPTMHKDRK